ncbi:MAG: carboxypeptidase regulatory-like domain-containing protein, partial [Planctomycetes bacterium]|nr:carboxypeptidase regulatory-like domain-containing protein [Planctomycetota bacterium]
DGFTGGITGTGTSRVQIEALDPSTGTTLSVSSNSVKATHIVLTETGNNTGIFTANGRVYGSSTAGQLFGNLVVSGTATFDPSISLNEAGYVGSGSVRPNASGTATDFAYDGGVVALGTATMGGASVTSGVTFKILEITNSGVVGLIFPGTMTAANGTLTLAYDATTSPSSAFGSGWGTSSFSTTRVGAISKTQSVMGDGSSAGHFGSNASGLQKLIDGADYCLVQIGTFTTTGVVGGVNTPSSGSTYETGGAATTAGGSITVSVSSFLLAGPRSGDSIKVSYLDPLASSGTVGTITSLLAFGATGETGAVSAGATTVDINDFLTVTVIDGNLNSTSSSKESVAYGSWLGTVTTNTAVRDMGDRLTVKAYSSDSDGVNNKISVSFPDGMSIGTNTYSELRISNTDNTIVWVLPSNASVVGSGVDRGSPGSVTFRLGTQSTDTNSLVKGSSNDAKSFLGSANTSSFVATLDGLNNTVEISPDGTRWVAVPMTETGVNSSTFVGTIGFDYTAVRVTTNTTKTTAITFSDFTGTSTIDFADNPTLTSVIGTGSVVRVADDAFSEFAEVTSVSPTKLTVTKLSSSLFFTPWKTFVGVVGNDMDTARIESNVFYIGGYNKATYRIRYNDKLNSGGSYAAGNSLATTADNVVFQTHDGSLSVSPSGTVGLNAEIVVTVIDEDLNTTTADNQSTMKGTGETFSGNVNEVGLGRPGSGTANSNNNGVALKGTLAKQLIATRAKTGVNTSDFNSSTNTVDVLLTETGKNTGTFKGTFKLTGNSGSSTDNNGDTNVTVPFIKASNGDTITIYYNDSPSSSNDNNLASYTTVALNASGGTGAMSTDKSQAFLNGDSVVVTLIDNDLNTTSSKDNGTVKLQSSSDSTVSVAAFVLGENATNSGTFVGTFQTGQTSSSGTTPTVRAVANGTIAVIYQDSSPATDISTVVTTKNFGAELTVTESVALEGNASVSLYDAETNSSITTANIVNVNVKSSTDSTGTTLRLTETGNNTGTFLGTIAVSASDTLVNTRVKAATGDTVTVSFTDNPDADGSISVVTDTASVGSVATPTPTVTASATPVTSPTATATATPVASPTPTPVQTGSIAGFVTDADTGEGIEGATVTSVPAPLYSATTDATGYYTIDNVPAGSVTLIASATGYSNSTPTSVTVVANDTTVVDFALSAIVPTSPTPVASPTPVTATLVVAVTDEGGNAVEGATVTVDGQTGTTGANGTATFSLETGDYTVTVSMEGYDTATVEVTVTAPVTIQAVELALTTCPDEVTATTASVDPESLSLSKGDTETVTVTVTDDEGCPAEGVKVTRKLSSSNKKKIKVTPSSGETDSNGQVSFEIKAKKSSGKASVKFSVSGVSAKPKVSVTLTK